MKNVCAQWSLVAVLMVAVAVPMVEREPKAAALKSVTVDMLAPKVVADMLPTPWPKKPGLVLEVPKVVADMLPTPWPKKPVLDRGFDS